VVAAESEYGNVVAQIGGHYVHVSSVESHPNTDPHTYEVSPKVAEEVSGAGLVIQNGLGYDSFMNKLESASPNSKRKVIDVQDLLGLPGSTPNPHLWYDPRTMPAVAQAIGSDLAALQPSHAAYFNQNVTDFDSSLQPWLNAIAAFKANHAGTTAATTEPVADYLLQAMGIDNLTPSVFQADIMNGTDPTPQAVALENGLFSKHMVKVFCYNQQVVDSLTESIRANAQRAKVPVVGVYETMPTPGYDYQSWMLSETEAIQAAVVSGTSTQHL
jgi:zinc/manganese transport system substrate-binding protein